MYERSFVKALFHGVVAEEVVFPFPDVRPDERPRVSALIASIRRLFGKGVDSVAIDRERRIPDHVLGSLARIGVFGLEVPVELGGLGLSVMASTRILQEVGGFDPAIAAALGAHHGMGIGGLLLFGSLAQKRRLLPALAKGEKIAAFALSEARAGSDIAGIRTRAELSADGTHYVLNGSKCWITNGDIADTFIVFARTSAVEEGNKPRLTAFVVDRAMGIKHGPPLDKLGIRGAVTTEIYLDDVRVPRENVLGEVGRGADVAAGIASAAQLGGAAVCTGVATRLIRLVVEQGRERRAFGRAVGEFGLIKDMVARMLSDTFALESMTYLTAGLRDGQRNEVSVESAICKVAASEIAFATANHALQIAGSTGYAAGEPFERMLRDARAHMLVGGTSEVLRCFVALASMPEVKKPAPDALIPPRPLQVRIADFATRILRKVFGGKRLSKAHPLLSREVMVFEQAAHELSAHAHSLMHRHGRDLLEMQSAQRRMADISIDLYATAACVARTTRAISRRGEGGARREIDLTSVFVSEAHKRLSENLRELIRNDDDLRRSIASRAYVDGAYPFDIV